jgi:hypothetical protein
MILLVFAKAIEERTFDTGQSPSFPIFYVDCGDFGQAVGILHLHKCLTQVHKSAHHSG